MSKDLAIGLLLDYYAPMLSEKQAEVLDLYYNDDLSLAEISEQLGFTRQAAMDYIKRGKAKLIKLDNDMHLLEKFEKATQALEKAKAFAESKENKELVELIEETLIQI